MTTLVQRLGATALISFRTNPAGIPATLKAGIGPTEPLVYVLPDRVGSLPEVREKVHCLSDAGQWAAIVREVRDGELVLERPSWLVRRQERRSVRVEASLPVVLEVQGERVAGRLVDLSAGGGAVIIESPLAPLPGVSIGVELPRGGTVQAVVRSRRPHEHRLLRIMGLEWMAPEGRIARWLEGEVAGKLRRARR